MPTMLARSMKKRMEYVLQESAKVGHTCNLKWLEQPKINIEEAMTFHSGEKNKLKDIIENIENCTTYRKPSTEIATHQD
jgi:hypothetical protein